MSTLLRSSAVMAAGTLVSRVLGMGRALVLAQALGLLTLASNAFAVANTVPNSIYMLVAGGVLNAVLVPQIARAAQSPDGGREHLDRLLTLSIAALLLVTLVVVALAPFVPVVLASSLDADAARLVVVFAYWCLPQVFFYGLYTLFGQVLNAKGRFGAYMWAPAANNVVAIIGLLVFMVVSGAAGDSGKDPADWTALDIALVGGTATLGVAVQALLLIIPLRRAGVRFTPRWGLRGTGLSAAGSIAGWTFAAALVGQLGYVVTSQVAISAAAQGAAGRTVYDNAYLIFMLPHSLVTVSLVTALFTRLSHSAAVGDDDAVRDDLSQGMRLVGAATVPATFGVLALGPDLTRLLFSGRDIAETDAVAAVVAAMILGLVPFSIQYLFQRGLYAYEKARTAFAVQIPVALVASAVAVLGVFLLPVDLRVVGIGFGLSVGAAVGAALSGRALARRLGSLDGRAVLRTHVRLVLAAAPAAGLAWLTAVGVHGWLGRDPFASLVALAGGGTVLTVGYLVGCRVLHVAEVTDVLSAVRGRVARRR